MLIGRFNIYEPKLFLYALLLLMIWSLGVYVDDVSVRLNC
jgi:hypothetical protein